MEEERIKEDVDSISKECNEICECTDLGGDEEKNDATFECSQTDQDEEDIKYDTTSAYFKRYREAVKSWLCDKKCKHLKDEMDKREREWVSRVRKIEGTSETKEEEKSEDNFEYRTPFQKSFEMLTESCHYTIESIQIR